MKVRHRIIIGIGIAIGAVIVLRLLIGNHTVALLSPAGPVAAQELDLMRNMVLIMLVVVVPLFVVLFAFAWKYRADNPNAAYRPNQKHRVWSETFLWLIPAAVVAALWVVTWHGAYALDPAKPIASSNPTLTIQVVALPWKWLFIYPQQNIATVNFIEFPEKTPVHFELTADAPMSSFWIPQLGSQIYAMAAMQTQINLMADSAGEYTGKNTEINGAGYAGMQFIAKSTSQTNFENWVQQVQQMPNVMDSSAYNALVAPSESNPAAYYSSVSPDLFNSVIMKFMGPDGSNMIQTVSGSNMPAMQMPGM